LQTVKALTGTKEPGPEQPRPQEVYTPHEIVELLLYLWGEVALDPCWGPRSVVPARTHYYVPERFVMDVEGNIAASFESQPGDEDGLALPWCDHTFANPPFQHPELSYWLKKAMREGINHEVIVLSPVRPHRVWYREALAECTRAAFLNPVKFLDNVSAHPQPMSLLYWGQQPGLFAYWIKELGLGGSF